jgi:hypothetical protein
LMRPTGQRCGGSDGRSREIRTADCGLVNHEQLLEQHLVEHAANLGFCVPIGPYTVRRVGRLPTRCLCGRASVGQRPRVWTRRRAC